MASTLSIEMKSGTIGDVILSYSRAPTPGEKRPRFRRIEPKPAAGGKYTATVDVDADTICRIVAEFVGGAKIEMALSPAYVIVQPGGKRWPVTASVDVGTRDMVPYYFDSSRVQS